MFLAMVLVAGLACQFLPRSTACSRSIYEQGGKGASVVRAVVDKINRLGIFPNDRKFLCRIAWVESRYGIASGTFRTGYYGGIWQVMKLEPNYIIHIWYINTLRVMIQGEEYSCI